MALLLTRTGLREGPPGRGAGGPGARGAPAPVDADTRREPRLCCRSCGGPVTETAARISIAGAHEHDFVNPGGLSFHIACFSRAPGCVAAGEPQRDWSWFGGYAWRVALCGACRAHLGWRYEAMNADGFFGIITARLAPCRGGE